MKKEECKLRRSVKKRSVEKKRVERESAGSARGRALGVRERESVCVESDREAGEKAAPSTGPSPCAGGVRFLEKRTSELCARVSTRGRADRAHVADEARETPAASTLPTRKGKLRLPFLFLFIWGLCVTAVGGLV